MRNIALLAAGVIAIGALVGCSDGTVPNPTNSEQSSDMETLPGESNSGSDSAEDAEDAEGADPTEASGDPAPTVAAQEPGSPLVVTGAELAPPDAWQVSGVSSDDSSEVVGATSADGQFISLRSVRTDAAVEDQITEALRADPDHSAEAPEVNADGETLRGVETALTASGGQAIQLRYFVRRAESLISIDIVTNAEQKEALLAHLGSALSWR